MKMTLEEIQKRNASFYKTFTIIEKKSKDFIDQYGSEIDAKNAVKKLQKPGFYIVIEGVL